MRLASPLRHWAGVRWTITLVCVALVVVANDWLQSYHWARIAIGALLGLALATELLLPRMQRGWGADADTFWHHVTAEIHRARRHERPLLLVRWAPEVAARQQQVLDDVREQLRGHDAVCAIGAHLYLMLAEIDVSHAVPVLSRLGVPTDIESEALIAEFPVDGLTVDGLLEGLRPLPIDGAHSTPLAS